MSDKFDQIFPEERTREDYPFGEELEDQEESKKRRIRVRNRHRLIGLAAIVLLAVAIAPAVFRPTSDVSLPKAKTEIPAVGEQKLVTQIELNANTAQKAAEAQAIARISGEKVAQSLSSSDNMVRPNTRPSEEKKQEAKSAEKADVKAQNGSEPGKAAVRPASADDPMGQTIAQLQEERADLKPLPATPNGRYFIRVLATSNKAAASVKKDQLTRIGLPAYIQVVRPKKVDLWSVRVGHFATQGQAAQAVKRMKENGVAKYPKIQTEPAKKQTAPKK